ncbi:MAG: DsbC family protein [Xanthomonadales bacterium]|nr:DsbC family protein [Xanthomonadales bacterium]
MNPSIPRARRFILCSASAAAFAAAVFAAVLPGHAQAAGADEAVRAAVQELAPQAKIDKIEVAPMPGFRQVLLGGQLLYVSDDGKYLLQGTLFDAKAKRDLTAARVAIEHKSKVDAVPQDKRIVFGPEGKPKYKVTVFTDFDCGYCRKLHSDIAEINKRGIEVDYLFFPRSGPGTPSFDKAVSVWCADDRKAAFTAAKSGVEPKPATCANPVAEQFQLGNEVGVNGTPTILAPDGTRLGGYLPPDQLLSRLEAGAAAK